MRWRRSLPPRAVSIAAGAAAATTGTRRQKPDARSRKSLLPMRPDATAHTSHEERRYRRVIQEAQRPHQASCCREAQHHPSDVPCGTRRRVLGLAKKGDPQIDARDEHVSGLELRCYIICSSIIRVVEPAAAPAARISGVQTPKDSQTAESARPQHRVRIMLVAIQLTLPIPRNLQPENPAAQQTVTVEELNSRFCVN